MIKTVTAGVPFNENLILKDISLTNKGDDEDKVFGENPFLYKNLRRGNTVMEILDEDKRVKKTVLLRKGLKKFFDVYLEYLEIDIPVTESSWVSTNKHFKRLKAITLDPVQAAFSDANTVLHIYRLGKANGENAQVNILKEGSRIRK